MKFFEWWKNPTTINQSILKGLVGGTIIGAILFAVTSIAFDLLFEKTPSSICREHEVFGSSAWVACVDRVVRERGKEGS
jgi:hypothetical protein